MSGLENLVNSSRNTYKASSLESRYPTVLSEKCSPEYCTSCTKLTEGHKWYGFCNYTNDFKSFSGKASVYSDEIQDLDCGTLSHRDEKDMISHINRPAFICLNCATHTLEVLVPTFEKNSSLKDGKSTMYRSIGNVPVQRCDYDCNVYISRENMVKLIELRDLYNHDASNVSSIAWQLTELFGSSSSVNAVTSLMRAALGKEFNNKDIDNLLELAESLEHIVNGLRYTAESLENILADDETDDSEI